MGTPVNQHLRNRDRAEQAASAFPPLLIHAHRIADTIIHGVHGRRHAGPGEEFWQFRPYSPGDAAQRIDWRRSARGERLLVRQNEWAATNTLWSWVSRSPGMEYRSHLSTITKYDRASLIALTLSVLATHAGERVASLGAPFNPGHTAATLEQLAIWYTERSQPAGAHSLKTAQNGSTEKPAVLPGFATFLMVSDFLEPVEQTRKTLQAHAANQVTGHLVQVLDPAEETFPFTGRTEFVEMDGDKTLLAGKAEDLRKAYQDRLASHRDQLKTLARSLGWTFTVHHTDRPPHSVLLPLYQLIAGQPPGLQFARTG